MIKKLKAWLYGRFLPAWCKDDLLEDNARLQQALIKERQKIAQLEAYIDGMQAALRRQPRIIIQSKEGSH